MLVGCANVDYDVYYNSMGLAPGTYIPLAQGARPQFVETLDLPGAIERYKAAGYIVMGTARKSGPNLRWDEVIDFAQKKGATLVLYGALPLGTIERRYAVPVTSTSTTHHSGTVHSNTYGDTYNFSGSLRNTNPLGNSYNFSGTVRNTNPFGNTYNYSGTSTTTTTSWEQRSYRVRSYDHFLLFLVKKA